ncbi:S-adenosylmethionine decarboxylase proenzyme 4-like [Vicia villosa]|uniref:S-adenosylmethionine decarboxylase proenzyme 4-like n=1 Tax=Vicia villosa TaxID=3911 RepID=UPI00273B0CB9|nr:S-adenosylmethionine decarboxylase proenzyme 4-like [Vicia villosa]
MSFSGFEGFEKRLELHFIDNHPNHNQLGLRKLEFESIQQILQAVQCTVVSALANSYFDSYVLSESSLFVYPTKIIIKTCGTTQLLKSITPLIYFANNHLNLTLSSLSYTRGSFIFPNSQPFPHTSFNDELTFLQNTIPSNLCFRKASIMPSKSSSHSWHVFTATQNPLQYDQESYTMEICMTGLDPILARKFFREPNDEKSGHSAGKEMTELTGINEINKEAFVCDFAFDPCGYSMNGIDGELYSTIHVTPEDGYSYASFECVGSLNDNDDNMVHVLRKVVQIFRPGTMSVSIRTCSEHNNEVWRKVAGAVEPLGLKCRSCVMDHFPAIGCVVFQTFTPLRRKNGTK